MLKVSLHYCILSNILYFISFMLKYQLSLFYFKLLYFHCYHFLRKRIYKDFASNFCKSSIFSPTPIYFTVEFQVSFLYRYCYASLASTISFVSTMPDTFAASLNCFTCCIAFLPVVPSKLLQAFHGNIQDTPS